MAGLCALAAAIPLVYLGVRLSQAGLEGLGAVLARPRLPLVVTNSLVLAATVTAASMCLGIATAVLLARLRLPARRLLIAVAAMPLAVPSYLTAYGWLATWPSMHGWWASWLVLTVITVPYVTLPVLAALRTFDPARFLVARTLGHRPWVAFRLTVWPAIAGAATSGGLLVFLYTLADFGGVALFRYPVLTTAIHQAYGTSFDRHYAAVLALILVLIATVVFAGERRASGHRSDEAGRIDAWSATRIRGATAPAIAVIALAPVLAVVVPLASLVNRLLAAQTVRAVDLGRLIEATMNTIALAFGGAAIAIALATPIAILASRYPGPATRLIEVISSLPLALPGIVVGLGLVFFSLTAVPSLYQSALLLAFAYGIIFLPKAVGSLRSGLDRVPADLDRVAATLGYSRHRRWWHVSARLALPSALVGAMFVAVTAMKELPATLMLRPTGTNTLAIELWARTDTSAYGAAVPYAIALIVTAAIPAFLLTPRGQGVR